MKAARKSQKIMQLSDDILLERIQRQHERANQNCHLILCIHKRYKLLKPWLFFAIVGIARNCQIRRMRWITYFAKQWNRTYVLASVCAMPLSKFKRERSGHPRKDFAISWGVDSSRNKSAFRPLFDFVFGLWSIGHCWIHPETPKTKWFRLMEKHPCHMSEANRLNAEECKRKGNELFGKGKFRAAFDQYTEAIVQTRIVLHLIITDIVPKQCNILYKSGIMLLKVTGLWKSDWRLPDCTPIWSKIRQSVLFIRTSVS